MIDRDKVANGLRHCLHYNGSCLDCPYDGPNCQNDVLDDTIAMLKELEPVEPTFKKDDDGIFVWTCGLCGAYMYHIYDGIDKAKEYAKYCRQCGRKVKWE